LIATISNNFIHLVCVFMHEPLPARPIEPRSPIALLILLVLDLAWFLPDRLKLVSHWVLSLQVMATLTSIAIDIAS
jgi:hypothetical protein